jgi:hypothetical protein
MAVAVLLHRSKNLAPDRIRKRLTEMKFLRTNWSDEVSNKTIRNAPQIFSTWDRIACRKNWHEHLTRKNMCQAAQQVVMFRLTGCKC